MKKTTFFLGIIACAAMIFAGASSAFAAPAPLYFKLSISCKGYLVDDDNATEEKGSLKTAGYLMWLWDDYVLVTECEDSKDGWYVSTESTDPLDSGTAIYIADEEATICTPIGKVDLSLAARISYKSDGQSVTSAKLATLGAQFVSEIEGGIYIVGGAQVKGATIDFDKLPQAVQDIFNNY